MNLINRLLAGSQDKTREKLVLQDVVNGCCKALRSDEKFGSTFASLDIQPARLAYLCDIRSSYAGHAVTMQRHSRLFRS